MGGLDFAQATEAIRGIASRTPLLEGDKTREPIPSHGVLPSDDECLDLSRDRGLL